MKSHPLNPQDLRRAHLEAEQQLSLATRQAEEKITKGTWSGGLGSIAKNIDTHETNIKNN